MGMFRAGFISPARLIRRCLIFSLPQFPSAGTRCTQPYALHAHFFSKLSARDANVHLLRSTRRFEHVPGCLFDHKYFGCSDASAHGELHNETSHTMGERMRNIFLSLQTRRSDLQETNKQKKTTKNQKDSGHCDTLMLSWKDHAKAEQNFLPSFCASSELVFVFPIKSHFYINRLEQRGIGKLTQSPPRTKDDTGVTCLPLQKNVIYKRHRGKQRKY